MAIGLSGPGVEAGERVARARAPFLPALTGVRAFAAFWVLALHVWGVVALLAPGVLTRAAEPFALAGALGVDVFFVLSGFIISYNYARTFDEGGGVRRWRRFLWARLARIYPVHVVLLAALVPAVWGLGFGGEIEARRWSARALAESLLLVHAWSGNVDVWNPVSWSISSEWLAYLTFPLLSGAALWIVRRSSPATTWLALSLIAALPALHQTVDPFLDVMPPMPPLQILSEFLAGCMVYRLFESGRRVRGLFASPMVNLALLLAVSAGLARTGASPFWSVLFVPPMLLGLAQGRGFLSRAFAHPWCVYWGKVSYALYMTHYLWLWVMHTAFPEETLASYTFAARMTLLALHVLPVFAIAALTYHLVEEPARHALARLVERPDAHRRAPSAAPEALSIS